MKLLVAEDDAAVASNLFLGLRARGFVVDLATSGTQARVALERSAPDLIVLDLMLPGLSGLELLEELSGKPHPPIIVLTARTDLNERLRCFALGAVDYVPKPFFLEELVARINARLTRRPETPRRLVRFADVELDLDRRTVSVAQEEVSFTRHEFDVLAYLAQRPGRAVTREDLCERAVSGLESPEPRTIDSHIARVRKKLDAAGERIVTVWGIGYRFVPDAERT
jgi:two-component system OmpR family response regulator